MFAVDQVIAQYYPALNNSRICTPVIKPLLRRILHEQAFIRFAEQYSHLHGIEFVEQSLDYFNFSYAVSDLERENIPASGKVVIILAVVSVSFMSCLRKGCDHRQSPDRLA